jgi:DNA polymerase-3 subunit beta
MEVVNKMKFKVPKETLLSVIQKVQNIVSTKATLPILSNMLMDVKKGKLRLNAPDLDIGISCEIPVETIEEGAITIPAKRFSDIIKEMPSGDILIHAKKNNHIDIEGDGCRFKVNGLPHEEFPKFPEFKDKEVTRVSQELLKNMLNLTSFAVSHEESRYVLNGVLLEISGDIIRMVATDGRRLAKIEKRIDTPVKKDVTVIIPIKAVQEISRNLHDEGDVSIVVGVNQVLFDINGVLIATRIIEGEFPNYNQVIPKPAKNRVKMNTQELLSSIRRANLLATPDFQAVKFEVFSDKMVVSKTTPDVGESREEISVEYGGSEMIVGFNPVFLIDFLKNVEQEQIDMELLGADKPAVMRLGDYLYLALPMRI